MAEATQHRSRSAARRGERCSSPDRHPDRGGEGFRTQAENREGRAGTGRQYRRARQARLRKSKSRRPQDAGRQQVETCYERVVEEVIFRDIVRRGVDVVQTQLLRYVRLSDRLAIRFHEGMTRANTHSHDNPAADTVLVPAPHEFAAHIVELETLIADLKAESDAAEAARPQMKPKK